MDTCGVVQKRVSVSAGNGDAWQFYRKSDFYPRLTVLEQTDRQTTTMNGIFMPEILNPLSVSDLYYAVRPGPDLHL